MTTTVDLDDTSRCPAGPCDTCSGTVRVLVETRHTPVGVYCLRTCRQCEEIGLYAVPSSWLQACHRVCAHCGHLGIDLDQMAALRTAQDEEER